MQTDKLWKAAPFFLPAIWIVVIVSNVWYHGPKAWIFVSIGMLVMIGMLTQVAIMSAKRADRYKETIEKIKVEHNDAVSANFNAFDRLKAESEALMQGLTKSSDLVFDILRIVAVPYPQTWRGENRVCGGWGRNTSGLTPGNHLVFYASLPTENGWKQTRWELPADTTIGYSNDKPIKSPDPVITTEETLSALKAHLRWLANEDRVLPPQ